MIASNEIKLIGLDLDNTVIDYAPAYAALGKNFGFEGNDATRYQVRSTLRKSAEDDEEWQRFQALLYTEGLTLATPAQGIIEFLEELNRRNISAFIASNKTSTGPERFGKRDLRTPAREWLHRWGISPGLVDVVDVTFHETLSSKVDEISSRAPNIFIDDLIEVFDIESFPVTTTKVLYQTEIDESVLDQGFVKANFRSLSRLLFK